MSRMSTRRRMAAGLLTLGLFVGVVACGDDDGSDSDRDELLALLLAAAQGTNQDPGAALVAGALGENPDLLNELTDEQVDELLELLESSREATPTTTNPEDEVAPETAAPAPSDASTSDAPSVGSVSIPDLSIPSITVPSIDWDLLGDLLDEDDDNDAPTISIISIPGITLPGGIPTLPKPSIGSVPSIPAP
ncbi:MAG: hypothetical protein ACO39Y_03560 [Ilumatobacteraceae bacterium]